MGQFGGHAPHFDRKITSMSWDIDRTYGATAVRDLEGLTRALALAVPISALLWIAGAAALLSAIRQ